MCKTLINSKQGGDTAIHWARERTSKINSINQRLTTHKKKFKLTPKMILHELNRKAKKEKPRNQYHPNPQLIILSNLIGKNYFIRTDQKSYKTIRFDYIKIKDFRFVKHVSYTQNTGTNPFRKISIVDVMRLIFNM